MEGGAESRESVPRRGVRSGRKRLPVLFVVCLPQNFVTVTGVLADDEGLTSAIHDRIEEDGRGDLELIVHPLSIQTGAIGAALWAGFRHERLVA